MSLSTDARGRQPRRVVFPTSTRCCLTLPSFEWPPFGPTCQQPRSGPLCSGPTCWADWLSLDLATRLRRLRDGEWIGNEEPATFTPYRRGPRRY